MCGVLNKLNESCIDILNDLGKRIGELSRRSNTRGWLLEARPLLLEVLSRMLELTSGAIGAV
jgi:hypothetical protein